LQMLSLNALLFHRQPGDPGYTLLTYANLTYVWTLALSVVGVKQWSGRSWLFSFLFSTWLLLVVAIVWAAIKAF